MADYDIEYVTRTELDYRDTSIEYVISETLIHNIIHSVCKTKTSPSATEKPAEFLISN